LPPVHLAPDNVLRQMPTPALPQPFDGSQVAQASATEAIDDPFQEMEQELAVPLPPVDRISQTPARPETRPASQQRRAQPSQSVVGRPQNQNETNGSILQRQVPLADPHTGLPGAQPLNIPTQNRLRTPARDASFGGIANPVWQQEEVRAQDPPGGQVDRRSIERDCGEYRELLLNNPISSVALDISPSRRGSPTDGSRAVYRDWTDLYGQPVCSGTLVDLKRGYALVDTGNGIQRISVAKLSENDLAAIAELWEMPSSCIVSTDVFSGRCWAPQTMTWHASNLCHKPLYFEDIQLERYGHSDGPFMQPVRSAAHFLISLTTLPYQTGIHPPNECQYALGYYRPGNCAPWLGYPVPISAKGAVHQAAFMLTGAFTIF